MAQTSNTPPATSTPTTVTHTVLSATSQRQSCDRCHKQKLKCTREKRSNSGVCDRCFGKPVQCVYSSGLPKGRPISIRRNEDSSNRRGASKERSHQAEKKVHYSEENIQTSTTKEIIPDISEIEPLTSNVHISLMISSEDLFLGENSKTSQWDDIQCGLDWNDYDSSQLGAISASLNTSEESMNQPEETIPPLPVGGQPAGGSQPPIFKRSERDTSNLGTHIVPVIRCLKADMRTVSDDVTVYSYDDQPLWTDSIIFQLSQFISYLSALREASCALTNPSFSSSSCNQVEDTAPRIDGTAFKSVGTWLAYNHGFHDSRVQSSPVNPLEDEQASSSSTQKRELPTDKGILHDVFSASHRLLKILGEIQANNAVRPFTLPASHPGPEFLTGSSQADVLSAHLAEGLFSFTPSQESHLISSHTIQIIRHMINTCNTLLLDIYDAVLIALQHDVCYRIFENLTLLEDVRVAMTVQLCSYLLERQQRAVALFLEFQSPISPVSISNAVTADLGIPISQHLEPSGGSMGLADRRMLGDVAPQLQDRLSWLRQTLQYM